VHSKLTIPKTLQSFVSGQMSFILGMPPISTSKFAPCTTWKPRRLTPLSRIYKSQEKFTKEPTFYRRLGVPGAMLSVIDTDAHRDLRNIMSPYFSTRALDARLDDILSKCDAACRNVLRSIEMSQPIDTQKLASRLTVCAPFFDYACNTKMTLESSGILYR
jgi:hypothetical protein